MEIVFKNFEDTTNQLLKLLTLHLSDPIVNDELLSLCTQFKRNYSAAFDAVANTASPNWNSVTLLLCYFSTLKKIYLLLLSSASRTTSACLSIFPVIIALKDLFQLASYEEKIVRHSAQNCFVVLLIYDFKKETNGENCEESLKYFLTLIAENIKQSESPDIVLRYIELLIGLLKQFKFHDAGACSCFFEHFLPKFCVGQFGNTEYCKKAKVFHTLLKLFKEILHSAPQSNALFATTTEYIFSLIMTADICSLSVSYRLIFLQIAATCLKFYQGCNDENGSKAAKLFLKTVLNGKLVPYFLKEPSFVGFGGRESLNNHIESGKVDEFSPAEKMLLLNNTLTALSIVTELQDGTELIAVIETKLQIFLGASSCDVVSTLIEVYLEQDDALIEFLLLHLTNFVVANRYGITFIASPHHFFVKMLQHLSYDSSILLDWLTSNETQFLLYFLKYLKYLGSNFDSFCAICNSAFESDVRSTVISTLKNVRISIEKLCSKELFPYPITPLLKVIKTVENLNSEQ